MKLSLRSSPVLAALLMTMTLAVLSYQMWLSRQEILRHAQTTTHSMTALLELSVTSDFDRLDGILAFAASDFSPLHLSSMSPAKRIVQSARLAQLIADFPPVAEMFIFDAAGKLLVASSPDQQPFSITDRPHFQILRDHPEKTTVFSDPQVMRSTGKEGIVQLRAIRDVDGRLLGLVSAAYHVEGLTGAVPSAIAAVADVPMAAVAQTPPCFDESALLKPLGGNRTLAHRVVDSALNDFPNYFAQLEQACQVSDWAAAERPVHTMKGLAAQIGGAELAQWLREADIRLKAGEAIDAETLAGLQAAHARLVASLQHWQASSADRHNDSNSESAS